MKDHGNVPFISIDIHIFFTPLSYLVSGSILELELLQNCSVGGLVYSLYIFG